MVRSLTLTGLSVKKVLEETSLLDEYTSPVMDKRTATSIRRLRGETQKEARRIHVSRQLAIPTSTGGTDSYTARAHPGCFL